MAIKVAVIGMGGIGNIHAQCYHDNPLAELVAVCDVDKAKADAAAEKFGVRAFYSEKEMLEAMPEIESVSVTTSGYENGSHHFEPAMEALSYNRHVLVEKPICSDVQDARILVAEAAKRGLYLGCDLNHYFTEPADRAKQLQLDGKIGEPVYCIHKVGFNGGDLSYSKNTAPRWLMPYAHCKAFLAHPFSVMRYFCGDIMQVQAFMDKSGVRKTADDPMMSINSIHVRFTNGGIGYLLSQRGDAMFGLGGWWSYEHAGTKGTFCIENAVEKLSYWDAEKSAGMSSPEPEVLDTGIKDFGATFPRRINAYLEDLTAKVPRDYLRASGRDALATLEYTFAAIRSYEEGGALVRPEPLPPFHGAVGRV